MKLITSEGPVVCFSNSIIISRSVSVICLLIFLAGCGDQVHLPSPAQLAEFNNAGPVLHSLDVERFVKAEIKSGPYRVVSGDVLELTMPAIIRFVSAEEADGLETITPYSCRISENGTITLPIVGDVNVEGKILSQIESIVVDAYYPEYVITRPSVFIRILEYKTTKVSISGAVEKPGIYSLRSDQMSLVALLMEAGGIIDEGASVIRIVHQGPVALNNTQDSTTNAAKKILNRPSNVEHGLWQSVIPKQYGNTMLCSDIAGLNGSANQKKGIFTSYLSMDTDMDGVFDKEVIEILNRDRSPRNGRITDSEPDQESEAFVLPIKGLNIPFTDVVLQDGDRVFVERLLSPLFSVVGLVDKPGNFPYPPDAHYNLMQALAFAGGLDRSTEPRYATIYRLTSDNTIISAVFEVVNIGNGSRLTETLNTQIKAGDIIAVEHTPRTRTKLFLDTVFRINIGTYWRMNDAWEN